MSGLTMGLLSLDLVNLKIIAKSGTERQKKYGNCLDFRSSEQNNGTPITCRIVSIRIDMFVNIRSFFLIILTN